MITVDESFHKSQGATFKREFKLPFTSYLYKDDFVFSHAFSPFQSGVVTIVCDAGYYALIQDPSHASVKSIVWQLFKKKIQIYVRKENRANVTFKIPANRIFPLFVEPSLDVHISYTYSSFPFLFFSISGKYCFAMGNMPSSHRWLFIGNMLKLLMITFSKQF